MESKENLIERMWERFNQQSMVVALQNEYLYELFKYYIENLSESEAKRLEDDTEEVSNLDFFLVLLCNLDEEILKDVTINFGHFSF